MEVVYLGQSANLLLEVLLKLEGIQREIGAVQETIVKLLSEQASGEVQQRPRAIPTENLGISKLKVLNPVRGLRSWKSALSRRQWLADRGISIKTKREESPLDEAFDRLCLFLGQRFESLGPFYNAVKQSLNTGGAKTLDLTGAPSHVISDTVQFAHMLLDHGFLADSEYIRNTQRRLLRFVPQSHGQVINFFTGGWLERYVCKPFASACGCISVRMLSPGFFSTRRCYSQTVQTSSLTFWWVSREAYSGSSAKPGTGRST